MRKFLLRDVSVKVITACMTMCLLAFAFVFACGFGDETATLMRNPTSNAISTPVNFTGAVTINGEAIAGTTGSASIITLGTVTTGTWHGTAIATGYGGTGNTTGTAASVTVVDSTDTSSFVAIVDSATGDLAVKTDAGLAYNAGTGVLTASGFSGPLTGNVTGDVTGNTSGTAANVTGTVAVANGGTGAATAPLARVALAAPGVYTGAFGALPVTTAKVKGDMYISDEGDAYICVSIGADTTGWKKIN